MSEREDIERGLRGVPREAFRERLRSSLHARAITLHREARRIGVIADSHCMEADGSDLPERVLDAFRGVDLIVHCGDLCARGVLDRLETVAPVLAIRSAADPQADGVRLFDGPRVLQVGEVRIGLTPHVDEVPEPGFTSLFGEPVQMALCGTSHRVRVERSRDVLVVNPGSPSLPAGGPPTVALLDLESGVVDVTIIELEESS